MRKVSQRSFGVILQRFFVSEIDSLRVDLCYLYVITNVVKSSLLPNKYA